LSNSIRGDSTPVCNSQSVSQPASSKASHSLNQSTTVGTQPVSQCYEPGALGLIFLPRLLVRSLICGIWLADVFDLLLDCDNPSAAGRFLPPAFRCLATAFAAGCCFWLRFPGSFCLVGFDFGLFAGLGAASATWVAGAVAASTAAGTALHITWNTKQVMRTKQVMSISAAIP